mmetsp:Transcript_7844/g.15025  ORF Transcript_7844/g.15025 Transcript_7844/m.15025 type:complete len:403 (+) Transcript_7844:12066-13274(+)
MRRLCTVFHRDVVLVAATRTPFGSFMGKLSRFNATTLGAHAISSVIEGGHLLPPDIELVVQGVGLLAGLGACPSRQAALAAGLSPTVACQTVTQGCASGMLAITLGAQQVALGSAGFVVAGGFESMSSAPFYQVNLRGGQLLGHSSTMDSILSDGMNCPVNGVPLGSVAEKTISEFGITKYDQSSYADDSYMRYSNGLDRNFFAKEESSITLRKEGEKEAPIKEISGDEEPLKVDNKKLSSLKPLFDPAGTITALTASSIADGAASVLLTSKEKAAAMRLSPLAYVRAFAHIATDASNFSLAVANAIDELLKATSVSKDEIQLWEICETFASIPLVTMNVLGIPHSRVNVNGGALCIGHPIGATGARQIVTLAHSMQERNAKRGVAAICSAGGEGLAVLLEM